MKKLQKVAWRIYNFNDFFFPKYFPCSRILDCFWPEFLEFHLYFQEVFWPLCRWWGHHCEPQWIHCLRLKCGDANLILKGLHVLPIECALFQNETHGFLNVESIKSWIRSIFNTVGWRDDDMIVSLSDGPMNIWIDWE